MKTLLIILLVIAAIAAQAAIMTAAEQYQALKAAKQADDANAEAQLKANIQAVEADRDLAIYKSYLKLRNESGLGDRLLKFTGVVTQKANVVLGKKQLVVQVKGTKEIFDLRAIFSDKIPDNINIGDRVAVSGTFENGNLVGATLTKSTVVPVI